LTTTQAFLKKHHEARYTQRHQQVGDSGEAEMINTYAPLKCPFCGSEKFKKSGRTKSSVQRYMCVCTRTFLPTTGTIFDDRKISISEWMEFCMNLFRHVSVTAGSWNNKNAFTTSRYWLQKLFITLEGVQSDIVFSDTVWLDETYYSVRSDNKILKENGDALRGLSKNQIRIGVATDKCHSVFYMEGTGKPSQKTTYETFNKHIKSGATLIHDGDAAHNKLVNALSLKSISYTSGELKGLPDKDNPLNPINRVHDILKKFLNAHSSFIRDDMQGYLDLFSFVTNPPANMLEKVELVINMAFSNPKILRYRDFFRVNTGF
jgi:hypothetical protein